ncbi:uncharacterized protein LOC135112922 isoform X2 [Scylla paramamosain]|uniref:uncharacterized protein LOC135112922 isoform X2 n=1 Tax=Scylla paramamosain TaxID=85552 RepID=UPI003083BE66
MKAQQHSGLWLSKQGSDRKSTIHITSSSCARTSHSILQHSKSTHSQELVLYNTYKGNRRDFSFITVLGCRLVFNIYLNRSLNVTYAY